MSTHMNGLVYGGKGVREWKQVPMAKIVDPTDAVLKVSATTICGSDLHILKGDVALVKPGTVLGHEAVGVIQQVGSGVTKHKVGDRVLVLCMSKCGKCYYCDRNLQLHCVETQGWLLGNLINGTQAEYVRTPFADALLIPIPELLDDELALMLADILPTGYEIGVLNGGVKKGDTVAVVGTGPVGLAAILTAVPLGPSRIIAIDQDDERLRVAKSFGATHTINPSKVGDVKAAVHAITSEVYPASAKVDPGVDVAMECVGIPATFQTCQDVISPGGTIANVGVHGSKVDLQLQDLWIKNINISTGMVATYSTRELMGRVVDGEIDATKLITHHFKLSEFEKAYDVFGAAATTKALKVVVTP